MEVSACRLVALLFRREVALWKAVVNISPATSSLPVVDAAALFRSTRRAAENWSTFWLQRYVMRGTSAFSPEYSRREIRGTYTRDTNQPNTNVFMRFYPEHPTLRVAFPSETTFRPRVARVNLINRGIFSYVISVPSRLAHFFLRDNTTIRCFVSLFFFRLFHSETRGNASNLIQIV